MTRNEAERLRRMLRDVGFLRVGFAAIGDGLPEDRYREWLRRGYHGEMSWIARDIERRLDPRRVVAGARSIIALAVPYAGDGPNRGTGTGDAVIAAYARGTDYHRVLERRLKIACRRIVEDYEGARVRWYVDTGPVAEKAWAEKAGIGWIGKNTCSIDPEEGSYVCLSVIITSLDLPPDEPSVELCGRCTLCLDACPTEAFVEPWVLDARRCLSYLTIEVQGPWDDGLDAAGGDRVFGCDICQDVCPWNHRERPPADPELAPRPENERVSLARLATLDRDSFRERFPQSAVRRARWEGLLRSVILALARRGSPADREILASLSRREDVLESDALRRTLQHVHAIPTD